jgi:hypothetical protein
VTKCLKTSAVNSVRVSHLGCDVTLAREGSRGDQTDGVPEGPGIGRANGSSRNPLTGRDADRLRLTRGNARLLRPHWKREFFDIDKGGPAPDAYEALERIVALCAFDSRIRGRSGEKRGAGRLRRSVGGKAEGLA